MTRTALDDTWLARFFALFEAATSTLIDRLRFESDDLYAFQALEQALESDNADLRLVAAHVETQRNDGLESLTLKPLEPLNATWKLDTLGAKQSVPAGEFAGLDRRTPNRLLSADELLIIGRFKRLYQQEFGRRFDIELFTRNDAYGRAVLKDAAEARNPLLAELADRFFDAGGNPTRHRRAPG